MHDDADTTRGSVMDLRGRSFVKELDYTAEELTYLIDLAAELKAARRSGSEVARLDGKNVALIFEKTSTRTRAAFEVASHHQGAHVTYLDPTSSQLGHKESATDTARVLSRMYDAIQFRGAAQSTVEELAAAADVPVYNGLTDQWHPTQMLADFLTMREHAGVASWRDISFAYLGDARFNMGCSLLVTAAILGSDVRIAAPSAYWPPEPVLRIAHERAADSGSRITVTSDVEEAVTGAEFVHTDVWVSMGESTDVWDERVSALLPYRVTSDVLRATGRDARFMHCLPAFHDSKTKVGAQIAERTGMTDGLEVSDEVFASTANIAFDQAENRLHTIKGLLVATLA